MSKTNRNYIIYKCPHTKQGSNNTFFCFLFLLNNDASQLEEIVLGLIVRLNDVLPMIFVLALGLTVIGL